MAGTIGCFVAGSTNHVIGQEASRHHTCTSICNIGATTLIVLALISVVLFTTTSQVYAETTPGYVVFFKDFSGVCQSGNTNDIFGNAMSWNRRDFEWSRYEPSQGQYNEHYLQKFGMDVLVMKTQGVHLLPVFGYNTSWSSVDGKAKSPLAAEHVADWLQMVDRVVKFLKATPYDVEYFQIWNEAHPQSGFWNGDLDAYMQRVHLPAANVIRANGAKVVYGGWPVVGSSSEYISLLDRHNAWSTLDVLDTHYVDETLDIQTLYDAAVSRGYPDLGIWQTEFGFQTDGAYIADKYPRFLSWALSHNWSYPDKYKLFWYPNFAPNDPKAYGYKTGLYMGSNLSPLGHSLQTMGDLFNLTGLKSYAVTASQGEAEGFAMNSRIVVAVHINPSSASSVQLSLPNPSTTVSKVERVDLAGVRQDITSQVRSSSQNLVVDVSTEDNKRSHAYNWNRNLKNSTSSFFVAFQLAR